MLVSGICDKVSYDEIQNRSGCEDLVLTCSYQKEGFYLWVLPILLVYRYPLNLLKFENVSFPLSFPHIWMVVLDLTGLTSCYLSLHLISEFK